MLNKILDATVCQESLFLASAIIVVATISISSLLYLISYYIN